MNTIDDVDSLLSDILCIPDDAVSEAQGWLKYTDLISQQITACRDTFILQVDTGQFSKCFPYVQLCKEEDGAMTIEAVSGRFLRPNLSPDAQNTLAELGWAPPEDSSSAPNYWQFLRDEAAQAHLVAELLIKTLRDVYGVTLRHLIELEPDDLADHIKEEKPN